MSARATYLADCTVVGILCQRACTAYGKRRFAKLILMIVVVVGLGAIWTYEAEEEWIILEDDPYGVIDNSQNASKPKFPLIVHQIWKSHDVPKELFPLVRSWQKHNPDWEYWFWSREEINALIRAKYPDFKEILAKYDQDSPPPDAVRYVILHEVGGIYADMDMECLQPLKELANTYSCFLSEESYEHVNLFYHRRDPIVTNFVMGCRAGHSLYNDVINRISQQRGNALQVTDPMFFTLAYEDHQKKTNIHIADHINLLPPRYLVPDWDNEEMMNLKPCEKSTIQDVVEQNFSKSNSFEKVGCVYNPSMDKHQLVREAEICHTIEQLKLKRQHSSHPESLTTRRWVHMVKDKDVKHVNIKSLVPQVKLYGDILLRKDTSQYYN